MDRRKKSEENEMKTDIIIVTKTPRLVQQCLDSVSRFTPKDKIGKVAICYTGQDKEEMEAIKQHATKLGLDTAVEQMEYNFAKCNNYFAKKFCTSECILFMNDDI